MAFRRYENRDLEQVRSLNERSGEFPFPNLGLCLKAGVIEEDSKIIAFGAIKLVTEAMLIIDPDLSKRDRMFASECLLRSGIKAVKEETKIDEIHAFVTGQHCNTWSRVLKRKFGFIDATGIALVLEI